MDFETILDGFAFLVSTFVMVASFVSKTMVWGIARPHVPQKATWFGRAFMFLAGTVGMFTSGLAILKRRQISVSPMWSDRGQAVSHFLLEILFLTVAIPLLIVSIRGLIRREEDNKVNRIVTVFLGALALYFLWEIIPGMAKEISAVFHR